MSYKIEIHQSGRGGRVCYMENGQELFFDWEFAVGGVNIFVPTPEEWDMYCRNHNSSWAEGRRQEILERIVEEVQRQKAENSDVSIEDNWIHFNFRGKPKKILDGVRNLWKPDA